MKAYKVVRNYQDRLVSAITGGEGRTKYVPGEWVQAACEGTPLFAFREEDAAREFRELQCWELWEIKARGIQTRPGAKVRASYSAMLSCKELARFWAGTADRHLASAPAGTVLCREIKLVRRLA